ncbi:MAG: SH3 domain-containing protein [Oscillospiraceae bacterium]|jgi:uncharacterized protein YgiM (DUF1202 family)|nr:SH3 domain-containing protein [Oscillospiraceae bacterium]
MLKRLFLVLLLVLALGMGGAQAEDYWMLNAQTNIYAHHDTHSSVIAVADSGTIYTIINATQVERWIKIAYSDPITGVHTEGWINESLLAVPSTVYADATGQSLSTGFVLCETLTLRETPSTLSARVGFMEYSATFDILEESNGWYRVQYHGVERLAEGWVQSAYVLKDPAYYAASVETPVLAYPAADAKRVGLIDPGTELAIIAETDDYYIVSLRSASGFIAK